MFKVQKEEFSIIHNKITSKLTNIETKYNRFSSEIQKYGNLIKNNVDDTQCIIELYICDAFQDSILYNKNKNKGTIIINNIELFNNDVKSIYSAFKNNMNVPNILHMGSSRNLYNCYLKN